MKLSELKPAKGSTKRKKRVGRGPGSGHGKTATRGHKGQRSRAGAKKRSWFEGGQMPFQRRVPKRGFTNPYKKEFQIVNVAELDTIADIDEITPEILLQKKKVRKKNVPVKILGNGDISRPLKVSAHAFSTRAIEKIEGIGGTVEVLKC
jgi:large subunit ribosomal protein L15